MEVFHGLNWSHILNQIRKNERMTEYSNERRLFEHLTNSNLVISHVFIFSYLGVGYSSVFITRIILSSVAVKNRCFVENFYFIDIFQVFTFHIIVITHTQVEFFFSQSQSTLDISLYGFLREAFQIYLLC